MQTPLIWTNLQFGKVLINKALEQASSCFCRQGRSKSDCTKCAV